MSLILSHALWLPIEGTVNQLLANAPLSQQQLTAHAGKQLQVQIQPYLQFELLILNQGIRLGKLNADTEIATKISGQIQDFKGLLQAHDKLAYLNSGQLEYLGDQALIASLIDIFTQLNIDWFSLLSPYTGSMLAASLSTGAKRLKRTLRPSFKAKFILQDFLQQESQQLVSHQQLQHFQQQITELAQRTEQLSQQIVRLSSSTGNQSHG